MTDTAQAETLTDRITRLVEEIDLGMGCVVKVGHSEKKGDYVQIKCWRKDVITGEMGWGGGGKAYPSEHASDSEILQMIFGLFLSYWTHEARENFQWRGRRIYGPHMKAEALWEAAVHLDLRSAQHKEDES